jgi:hypothetical protein
VSGTTLTIRPASKLLSGSDWTVVGAADYTTALSDNTDASYAQNIGTAGYLKQAFADFTLPPLSQVRYVLPRYRFRLATAGPGTDAIYGSLTVLDVFGTEDYEPVNTDYIPQALGGGFVTRQGKTRTVDPLGNPWTLLTLQSVRVQFRSNVAVAYAQCQMAELYLDILYNEATVPTVTGPTGTVTASTRPPTTWTVLDPEGDAQERVQVRIFTATQIAAMSATITNKVLTSNVATLTTALPHGYFVGDTVTVASVDATFNGNWLITAVTSTTYSYAVTHANVGTTAATGTSFSPNHGGTSYWYSGEAYTGALTLTPTVDLLNDSYSAYVTVADAGSGGRYGKHGVSAFTVSLTPPPPPTLTATYDGANYRNVLTAQAFTNLASANQADVETDTSGFVAVLNSTLLNTTAQASSGTHSLSIKSVASGTMQASTTRGLNSWPVVGSQQYAGYAELRSAVSVRTCRVGLDWFDAAGAFISTTWSSTAADSTSAWTVYRPSGVSPSNAAWADVIYEIQSTGAANEVHYADKMGLWPGTGTTWTRGDLSGVNERIIIEFSDNAGAGWAAARGSPFALSTYQSVTAYDYELPAAVARTYRARVVSVDSVGNVMNSVNSSTTAPLTFTIPRGRWRLVDPVTPANNVFILSKLPDEEAVESMGVFHPLGRWDAVTVSSSIGVDPAAVVVAGDGMLSCTTLTEAEALALMGAFFARNALYLISPSGSQNRYIRLTSPRKFPRIGGSFARLWTAPFVAVRRP